MRARNRIALSGSVGLLAVLCAGCGSSAHKPSVDPRTQVSRSVYAYLHAQSQGDGATACGLLTTSGQNELIAIVVKDGTGLVTSRPSCPDAVGLVHAFGGSQLLDALAGARVAQVHVSGSTATAQVLDGTVFGHEQVRLEKSGGQWKIAAVPGLGG